MYKGDVYTGFVAFSHSNQVQQQNSHRVCEQCWRASFIDCHTSYWSFLLHRQDFQIHLYHHHYQIHQTKFTRINILVRFWTAKKGSSVSPIYSEFVCSIWKIVHMTYFFTQMEKCVIWQQLLLFFIYYLFATFGCFYFLFIYWPHLAAFIGRNHRLLHSLGCTPIYGVDQNHLPLRKKKRI